MRTVQTQNAGVGCSSRKLDDHQSLQTGGFTLIEVSIVLALMAIVLGSMTYNMAREGEALSDMAAKGHLERKAEVLLERLDQEFLFAQGIVPQAWLNAPLSAAADELSSDTVIGFPANGELLLEPGTANEERLTYQGWSSTPPAFSDFDRGAFCTDASGHPTGTLLRWAGCAAVLEDQAPASASFFEGQSMERGTPVFYRGDGYGFSYQIPVDPAGTGEFVSDSGEISWGAEISGQAVLGARACFRFDAVAVVTEAGRQVDLNGDGDLLDSFDLGRIQRQSWDGTNPANQSAVVNMCPPMILQETCAWGSDLDADGFQDPIFLWDPFTSRLRVRLFLLVSNPNSIAEVRRTEVSFFLQNGNQN